MPRIDFEYSDELQARFDAASPEEQAQMKAEEADFIAFFKARQKQIQTRARTAMINFLSDAKLKAEPFEIESVWIHDFERRCFDVILDQGGSPVACEYFYMIGGFCAIFQEEYVIGVECSYNGILR